MAAPNKPLQENDPPPPADVAHPFEKGAPPGGWRRGTPRTANPEGWEAQPPDSDAPPPPKPEEKEGEG